MQFGNTDAYRRIRYAQRIMSVALEHARKYRYIETNPARDVITKFGKQGKTPDPYTIEQMQNFMAHIFGTEWEMPVYWREYTDFVSVRFLDWKNQK